LTQVVVRAQRWKHVLDSHHVSNCSYEWSGIVPRGATGARRLELAQFVLLSPPSYGTSRGHPTRLLGGPHAARALAFGPDKLSVLVPLAPAAQAMRCLKRGDVDAVLAMARKAVHDGGGGGGSGARLAPAWLQPVVGLAVAECLKQARTLPTGGRGAGRTR
jgi:hypothetical protein